MEIDGKLPGSTQQFFPKKLCGMDRHQNCLREIRWEMITFIINGEIPEKLGKFPFPGKTGIFHGMSEKKSR